MFRKFLKHYFEIPEEKSAITCLGGGVGTAQILKGLRDLDLDITAIVSMADDGGSAGRLRRAFAVPPPGDLINCLAALSEEESVIRDLFLYRFEGKRYGKDTDLGGQKLGNLIFVALTHIYKGNTERALEELSKIISSTGRVLPATKGDVNIWAKTQEGKKIFGEKNIDFGKYNGTRTLTEVHLSPESPTAYKPSVDAIAASQVLIAGPGDLFSTVLPVLIVPQIKKAITASFAKKLFIVNIANKPFETSGFSVSDYLKALKHNLGANIFDAVLVNTNYTPKIPSKLNYSYVKYDKEKVADYNLRIIEGDFVKADFPLYHDPIKVAKAIEDL